MSTFESSSSSRATARPISGPCISVGDSLQRMIDAPKLGLLPDYASAKPFHFVEPTPERREKLRRLGSQEVLPLSDDLILVRTDIRGFPRKRHEYDLRGWLYLHFRLDGASYEEVPDCLPRRLDRECFLLAASSKPRSLVRELLGDTWRTIGIFCRPMFAQQDLSWLAEGLPDELRRFRSGDEVDFSVVGELTRDMRAAAEALLDNTMPAEIRNVYLRAKAVELICLVLARIRTQGNAVPDLPVRLSRRDIQCIQRARDIILAKSPLASLAALAREVGINRNKLAVGFKHLFGVTVGQFDREQKLARARTLLLRDGLSVNQAAAAVGYVDPSNFTKAFKLAYGVLPSEICAAGTQGREK